MSRQLVTVPLIVAVLALASCKKKESLSDGPVDTTEYTIKLKKLQAGMSVAKNKNKNATASSTATFDKGGEQKRKSEESKENYSMTLKILEMPDGEKKPTRMEIIYDKYSGGSFGQVAGQSLLPRQKIVAAKQGGKYLFAVNAKLQPSDYQVLESTFNKENSISDEDTLPKKPVRINESWDVDLEVLKSLFDDMPIDRDRARVKGRLIKAYKKEERQYGVIEFQIDLPMRSGPFRKTTLAEGSKLTGTLTVDCCIDGTLMDENFKMDIKATMHLLAPGVKVLSEISDVAEGRTAEVSASAANAQRAAPEPSAK